MPPPPYRIAGILSVDGGVSSGGGSSGSSDSDSGKDEVGNLELFLIHKLRKNVFKNTCSFSGKICSKDSRVVLRFAQGDKIRCKNECSVENKLRSVC